MKSPISGKPMKLLRERRELTFRKEVFPVVYHFYKCEDSDHQFTTTELDELNLIQLYNQYRSKHNIPFPDEIRETREQYGISATKMAEILGFGINSYRNYEHGEVPNHSNARLIQLVRDPGEFLKLVQLSELKDADKQKISKRTEKLIEKQKASRDILAIESWLTGSPLPDEYTGFRKPDLQKMTDMIRYFTQKLSPWKTQMNKLLFFADFLHFKQTGYSITGFRYNAIDMGPVPHSFQGLFDYVCEKTAVAITATEFPNGGLGEQFRLLDASEKALHFTESEQAVIMEVTKKLGPLSTQEIIKISHKEKAWNDNKDRKSKYISYQEFGFDVMET